MSRKRIASIREKIEASLSELRDLHDELVAEWDDRSERYQESDNGQAAQAWHEELDSALDEVESAVGTLTQVEEGMP